jgi:hypothetical protein
MYTVQQDAGSQCAAASSTMQPFMVPEYQKQGMLAAFMKCQHR